MPTSEDEQELAAHEGAELQVDQHPRVARHAAVTARHDRLHERDRPVAVEDPVRTDREHEQDSDEDLEQLLRDRDRGMEERRAGRELTQPLVDRAQDLVPDAVRVLRRVVELGRRGRHVADRVVDLGDRHRHDEVEKEPDGGRGSRGSGRPRPTARGTCPRRLSHSTLGRIADAITKPRKSSAIRIRIFQSASARDRRSRARRASPSRLCVRFHFFPQGFVRHNENEAPVDTSRPRGAPARDRPARARLLARAPARARGCRVLPRSVAGRRSRRCGAARPRCGGRRGRGRPLGPDAPRPDRERARRRARVPAPRAARRSRSTGRCSRSSGRCSAASSATAPSWPATSRSTACRGGSRVSCSSGASAWPNVCSAR